MKHCWVSVTVLLPTQKVTKLLHWSPLEMRTSENRPLVLATFHADLDNETSSARSKWHTPPVDLVVA